MRMLMSLLLLACAATAHAQQPPPPTEQLARMKVLDYMAGEWVGTGWIMQGGPRQTFSGREVVQRKLDGLALLVEGRFTSRPPGQDHDVVSHETLAVISFDPATSKYRFDTYLANGLTGEYDFTVLDTGWRWGFQVPAGEIRYTMTLEGGKRWIEVGEISIAGVWRKFFEMTLERRAP